MSLPDNLQINAFEGSRSLGPSPAGRELSRWPLKNSPFEVRRFLKPPSPADPRDWNDPRVGWGVIAAEPLNTSLSENELAENVDLPDALRQLIADRDNAPVFRFREEWTHSFDMLRNWKEKTDLDIATSPRGIGRGCLPAYLLIYGRPDQVPWRIQYQLNANRQVGRIPLEGAELENYISALRANWPETGNQMRKPVVWATDHGSQDITSLMRGAIAEAVFKKYSSDKDIGPSATLMAGANNATVSELTDSLAINRPALVVTTSHGKTGPLTDPKSMVATLGLPVDQNQNVLDPVTLLARWQPDGAIWFAHACCSAGSDNRTLFDGLTEPGSDVDTILKGVASLGPKISPLPMQLLGAKKPLRAFVGHVEPTWDWTLRQPDTGQLFTVPLVKALYDELLNQSPVGYSFRDWYGNLGSIYIGYQNSESCFDGSSTIRTTMLFQSLASRDIQSMVILGDPTVALPPL